MRNFKLTIEYDGTNYFGWQRQKSSRKFPTIQGSIEKAARRVFNEKIIIIASGRTDTGVHAKGQVANFKTETRLAPDEIQRALNAYLPDDVLVYKIEEVPLSFHARYGAKRKWYRYVIFTSNKPSVFHRYYAMNCMYPLNLDVMKEASRLMIGKHDFSGVVFGNKKNKVREIYEVELKKNGNFVFVDVVGNGFLYKMVRRLVEMLVDVGKGKIGVKDVRKILSGNKSRYSIQTAPANGLCLMRVEY